LIRLIGGIGRSTCLCLWTLLATLGCSQRSADRGARPPAALRPGVDSAANRLLVALRSDSQDSLLALMGEDVVIMPPNEAILRGKAAVRAWYEQFLKQWRTSKLTVTNREVFIDGSWATEVAVFEWELIPAGGGTPITDRGSYMQVWHHEPDDQWLFSREVWNSSEPPPKTP
jgi:ketosteroid isomerase-like protein